MIYDPDYARAYSVIRCLAWSYGYAATLHGSFTRDLDIVLVPWTDQACEPLRLVKLMTEQTGTRLQSEDPGQKPHGRQCWTLLFKVAGDPRWIDISVMPRVPVVPTSVTPNYSQRQEIRIGSKTLYRVWSDNMVQEASATPSSWMGSDYEYIEAEDEEDAVRIARSKPNLVKEELHSTEQTLRDALQGMLDRFGPGFAGVEEQPKTFGCRHTAETCHACEGLVSGWKAVRAAEKALSVGQEGRSRGFTAEQVQGMGLHQCIAALCNLVKT